MGFGTRVDPPSSDRRRFGVVDAHDPSRMASPDDVCPFARPFPDGFDDCEAYGRSEFVALDMQYRPLSRLNSCWHLQVGTLPGRQTGFYARCGIGNAEARRRWVEEVEVERLNRVRRLSAQLAHATSPLTRDLWEAKGDQLRALRSGRRGVTATRRMRRLLRAYEAAAREFFEAHAGELEALRLPADALLELVRGLLQEWVAQPTLSSGWQAPESLLRRFPPEVRAFLRPNARRRAS
jgi:hypothetical protein